jgi:hypothetical protein
VQTVVERFQQRSAFGIKKYGTTLQGNNLPFLAWVQHMQEELMDAILYLEKLKSTSSTIPQTQTDTPPETSGTFYLGSHVVPSHQQCTD